MGMRLNDVQLSILHDAHESGRFEPETRYELEMSDAMVEAGYLTNTGSGIYKITRLGRGALKGQGGQR